jgi:hypothetical protein
MAGERGIIAEQAREVAQEMVLLFTPSAQRTILYTAERDVVLDKVSLLYGVNTGVARTGNLCKAANATIGTNTDVTVTDGIDFNGTANTLINPSFVGASATEAADGGHPPTQNIIAAGSHLILELNGAKGNLADVMIRIRYRTHKA